MPLLPKTIKLPHDDQLILSGEPEQLNEYLKRLNQSLTKSFDDVFYAFDYFSVIIDLDKIVKKIEIEYIQIYKSPNKMVIGANDEIVLDADNTQITVGSNIVLDAADEYTKVKVVSGENYVEMTPSGLRGVDSVLGTTFYLPTDGSPPEFSSGIIKEAIYEVYTSGVIKTAEDPTATGGLLINNTRLAAYDETPTKLLEFIYNGSDKGDAYIGDYDNDNHGIKYDHSSGTLSIRGVVIITDGSVPWSQVVDDDNNHPGVYGAVVTDPTFALTQSDSDHSYWNLADPQVTYDAAAGEAGPGLIFQGTSDYNLAEVRDGSGTLKYYPASVGDKIVIQIKLMKTDGGSGVYDGAFYAGVYQYDEDKVDLSQGLWVDVTPSSNETWETITKQVTIDQNDTHFISVLITTHVSATVGLIQVDSVNVWIEPNANFRHTSDVTKIDGGNIYAQTITLGSFQQSLIDSYGPLITDPTFALTIQDAINKYWDESDAYVETNQSYGENGPGLMMSAKSAWVYCSALDGAGTLRHIPARKGDKIYVETKVARTGIFNGSFGLYVRTEDKDKNDLSTGLWIDLTPTAASTWEFQVGQDEITDNETQFISLWLAISDTATAGYVLVDSLQVRLEPNANFRHSSDVTKIDGGDIYVGSTILIGDIDPDSWTFGEETGIILDDNSNSPRFFVGKYSDNVWLSFETGTPSAMEISGANITIKSGNGITIEEGGDVIINGDDSNPGELILRGADDYHFACDTTNERICIFPDTDDSGNLVIGKNLSLDDKRFNVVYMYTQNGFVFDADDNSGSGRYQSIVISPDLSYISLLSEDGSDSNEMRIYPLFTALTDQYLKVNNIQFETAIAAAAAKNSSTYRSSSDGKLYFKDSGGTSHALY